MNTLKPIETYYRGFRFRSRLEARYAVFSDKIGLKFQYEPEGFELPSGYYLPDFYLPELECYVEIKPPEKPKIYPPPRVYMAGRMEEPCWRPFNVYGDDYIFDRQHEFARDQKFAGRSIIYTGPFRTELRHHSFLHGFDEALNAKEDEVYQRSVTGIKACEVFFALFDDLEAYGTLVEVGMARMLGKKIVVGFGREYPDPEVSTDKNTGFDKNEFKWAPDKQYEWAHELVSNLWFAAEAADQVLYGTSTDDVLKKFGDWLTSEYPVSREVVLASELHRASDKGVNIFYGDPLEMLNNNGWISYGHNRICVCEKCQTAALAARQARFEHGQQH